MVDKNMRKGEIISLIMILAVFAVGFCFYPQMPEQLASHWNAQGEVDGYMPKFWGLFLMPFVSLGLFFIFLLIPQIDPLKENIEKFRKYFDAFIVLLFVYLFYLYLLTIFWNIGLEFNMVQFLSPAFGILFYYAGVLIKNAKRNWSIGIRTPWTLSNEKVWEKTHQIGGRLFKIAGIIALLGIIYSDYAMFFIIVPIILASIYLFIYSYFEYRKITLNNAK